MTKTSKKRDEAFRKKWEAQVKAEEKRQKILMEDQTPVTIGMLYKLLHNSRGFIQGVLGDSANYVNVTDMLKQLEEMVLKDEKES